LGLLAGWQHYIDLTVPAAKVTDDLAHFPVCIQIRDGAGINSADLTPIFDEVGANYKKIAVTAEDGVTQLYCEVVSWSSGDEYAELWVSKSGWTLNGGVENKVRIYFDNDHADNDSYVGLTGSTPAENVWDSNFKLVCHMNDNPDTSHIKDSTSNDNDGTKKGVNEPIETDGQIGKAQDFAGAGTDEYISVADAESIRFDGAFTISLWWKRTVNQNTNILFHKVSAGKNNYYCYKSGNQFFFSFYDTLDVNHFISALCTDVGIDNLWTCVWDGSYQRIYKNGAQVAVSDDLTGITPKNNAGTTLYLGTYYPAYVYPIEGDVDEIQFSKDVGRSSAGVGASYETQRDQFYNCGGFVTRPVAIHISSEPRHTISIESESR